MKIRLFGALKEMTGWSERDVSDSLATVEEVENWLIQEYPVLKEHRKYWRTALNHEYTTSSRQTIDSDSELAFLPPVSGG